MKPSTLAILAGVAVVAAGAAFVITGGKTSPSPVAASASGFAAFDPNQAASVELVSRDHATTLARAESGWTIAEKGGYPAVFEKVKELVVTLSKLEPVEPKTDRPELYAKIGVQAPDAEGSESTRVTVKDGAGKELASLILGTQQWGATPTIFVRRPSEARAWLVKGRLTDAKADPMTWVDRQVIQLGRDRVKSVELRHADGAVLTITRENKQQRDFSVAEIPAGRELNYAGAATPIAGALGFFSPQDVSPASAIAMDGASVSTYRTFDGLVATVASVELDGKRWVKFAFAFEPPPAAVPEQPSPVDPNAPADNAAPDQAAQEAAKKEADDLNAKLGPWAFQVQDASAKYFSSRVEDLLKPLPTPEPEPEAENEAKDGTVVDPEVGDVDEPPGDDVPPPADTPADPSADPK